MCERSDEFARSDREDELEGSEEEVLGEEVHGSGEDQARPPEERREEGQSNLI